MKGTHPPPAIFNYVFDVYNFSIILNLFESDKPYALSTRIIKNVRSKRIIFGKGHRIRVKKFKQNLPENYSKRPKIAITTCKLSKIFRGSMLPDPPRVFIAIQSALNLFCRKKKIRLKNKCRNYVPLL